jgi:WG containing repeat
VIVVAGARAVPAAALGYQTRTIEAPLPAMRCCCNAVPDEQLFHSEDAASIPTGVADMSFRGQRARRVHIRHQRATVSARSMFRNQRTCHVYSIKKHRPDVADNARVDQLSVCYRARATSESEAMNSEQLHVWPSRSGKFGLWGYWDRTERLNPRLIIAERFEQARHFAEDLAAVKIDGRWGYINNAGTVVIAPAFRAAHDFRFGMAEVIIDDRATVIDRTGRVLIHRRLSRAIPVGHDVVLASEAGDPPTKLISDHYNSNPSGNLPYGVPTYDWHIEPRGLFSVSRDRWLSRLDLYELVHATDGLDSLWIRAMNSRSSEIAEPGLIGLIGLNGVWRIKPRYSHVDTRNGIVVAGEDRRTHHVMSLLNMDGCDGAPGHGR